MRDARARVCSEGCLGLPLKEGRGGGGWVGWGDEGWLRRSAVIALQGQDVAAGDGE
jgi:hypothetical protein